jgi:hypothetical protein
MTEGCETVTVSQTSSNNIKTGPSAQLYGELAGRGNMETCFQKSQQILAGIGFGLYRN